MDEAEPDDGGFEANTMEEAFSHQGYQASPDFAAGCHVLHRS